MRTVRIRPLVFICMTILLMVAPSGLRAQRLIARASAEPSRGYSVPPAARQTPAPAPVPEPVAQPVAPGRSRIEISGYDNFVVPGQAKLDRKGGIDKVEFLAHRRD